MNKQTKSELSLLKALVDGEDFTGRDAEYVEQRYQAYMKAIRLLGPRLDRLQHLLTTDQNVIVDEHGDVRYYHARLAEDWKKRAEDAEQKLADGRVE